MTPKSHRIALALTILALPLAGCIGSADEPAGNPTPDEPAHAGGSPYVDLLDSPIRGLTPDEIETLRDGKGGGLALPAELNGYPGPKHVLEFSDELELTPEQEATMEAMYARMSEDARRVGARILDQSEELEQKFRDHTITEAELERLVGEISEGYAELKVIHMGTHLETMEVLTQHQVALYSELRGYGAADHSSHEHHD